MEILKPLQMADLRVVALCGDGELPPALVVVCDSVGPFELGWIEKSNILRHTLDGPVAPVGWRAAAYNALVDALGSVLPLFSYDDLFEEISMYYWEGADNDQDAIRHMIEYHSQDIDDIDQEMLPSAMNGRRPDFMLAENARPMKDLPVGLRKKIKRLRDAHIAVQAQPPETNAWALSSHNHTDYIPDYEDRSYLPPMTLVPEDNFARELDDVGRHGMEGGFMDLAGLCPLPTTAAVGAWFASLTVGAELIAAAQDLIGADYAALEARHG